MNKLILLAAMLAGCRLDQPMDKPILTAPYTYQVEALSHSMEPWISNGDWVRVDPPYLAPFYLLRSHDIVWRWAPYRMHMLQRRQGSMWITSATGGTMPSIPPNTYSYYIYNQDDAGPMGIDEYLGKVTILIHHGIRLSP